MNKRNRIVCAFLALLLLISLAACSTDPSGTTVATNPSETTAATDPIASTAPYLTADKPDQLPTEGWQNVNSITRIRMRSLRTGVTSPSITACVF